MKRLSVAALLALSAVGCAWLNKPAPAACQGDPTLMPCPCMNPLTPNCPAPPNDDPPSWSQDAKKPDGGADR